MAERRMFAKTIVLSDAFLDMPMSARCLYFTLGMLADDDGFVNAPRSIMRQCGASDDDMKLLIAKKFVLLFENGVIVIKHWRINNYLRNDRHIETKYVQEKETLALDENGAYTRSASGIPSANQPVYPGKYSIEKCSVEEESVVKDNNITILSSEKKQKEKSSVEGEREARVAHFAGMLKFAERYGCDQSETYKLADTEGFSREEIDAWRAEHENAV